MGSYYLTVEAEAKRKEAFVRRIAEDIITMDDGSRTFAPESDFWKLPTKVQEQMMKLLKGE